MTLAAGARLGPYDILSAIGAGGMGEVYKARDTRLERTVAIKVLPSHLSSSPESRQRFEREAKTISQLSHPHICAIYDVGREGDLEYLVMEYLEGETLAERLAGGPLALEQTLRYGKEIADALDKAHRQGIVHRDLKPGNVMLTTSGVKLLDFGLAKRRPLDAAGRGQAAAGQDPMARNGLTAISTMVGSPNVTQEGTILGTLQYMAPEQLEGKEADVRTDIFAFGAVLYEMASGDKAFSGTSQASLIGAILHTEPPAITVAQPASPPALDRVVRTCLAKDPEERWQSAGDVGKQLRWIAEGSAAGIAAPAVSAGRRGTSPAWLLAGALALAVLALSAILLSRRAPAGAVLRSTILPPEGAEFVSTWLDAGPVEISPDGSRLVFTARKGEGPNQLWVRALSESAARPLAGTEGGQRPFWSPDGRFIGFFADRALKKIDAGGGPVFTLAATNMEPRGGTWNRGGVILFTPDVRGPVYRVSAAGGKATPATVYGPTDSTHRYPRFLPDGKHFLYLLRHSGVGAGEGPEVRIGALDLKESKLAVSVASNALYASGYLLYVREGALVAQPFDLDALAARGEPATIAPDVRMDERFSRGIFSASNNGILVYQTGTISRVSTLKWFDRSGKVIGTVGEPAQFFNGGNPEISPDGERATAGILDPRTGSADIWMIDLASGTRSRFTTGTGDKFAAVWSRDGRTIAYNVSTSGSGYDIFTKATSGGAAPEKVLSDPAEFLYPFGFSPDGRFLLYQGRKSGREDLWALPLQSDRVPKPVAVSAALEQRGQFSPDGRYVAYMSDESGRFEIYVAVFPGPGGRWQVSQNGGSEPRWRKDGKELFFFAPDNRLMAAQVRTGSDSFEVGAILPLFQARSMEGGFRYDVSKDGSRFLVTSGLAPDLSPITLVTNWPAELPRK